MGKWVDSGYEYLYAGNFDKALEHFRRGALENDPAACWGIVELYDSCMPKDPVAKEAARKEQADMCARAAELGHGKASAAINKIRGVGSMFAKDEKESLISLIRRICDLSDLARERGFLALEDEDERGSINNNLLEYGLSLITDGKAPETVKELMETKSAECKSDIDLLRKKIIIDGVLLLQNGESTLHLEKKLRLHLEGVKMEKSIAELATELLVKNQRAGIYYKVIKVKDIDGNHFTFEFSQSGYSEYTTYSFDCHSDLYETPIGFNITTIYEEIDMGYSDKIKNHGETASKHEETLRRAIELALPMEAVKPTT